MAKTTTTKKKKELILPHPRESEVIKFWISGRGIGKARPRFDRRTSRAYLPGNYKQWKKHAYDSVLAANLPELPKPCEIFCYFVNFLSSDSDNLSGAVMDAMQDAKVIDGDSSSYVLHSDGQFCTLTPKKGEEKKIGILVKVYPCQLRELPPEFLEGVRIFS